MNRVMMIALVWMLVLPVVALAADGQHADVSISIEISQAMFDLEGEDMPDMPEMEPMVMTGDMYWTNDAMRFELDLGLLGGKNISLVDYKNMLAYTLNEEEKSAMKIDLNTQLAEMEALGMPSLQPDQMFTNWEDTLALMEEMPGINVEQLGSEKVGDRTCNKISFTMNMDALQTEDGPSADEMAAMGMAGEFAGVYWVDESVKVPIKMEMSMMGMAMTWLLEDLEAWTVDPAMLKVPADYTITSYEEMMAEMMGEMVEMEETESVPAA